jgi:hypothetical protein
VLRTLLAATVLAGILALGTDLATTAYAAAHTARTVILPAA